MNVAHAPPDDPARLIWELTGALDLSVTGTPSADCTAPAMLKFC